MSAAAEAHAWYLLNHLCAGLYAVHMLARLVKMAEVFRLACLLCGFMTFDAKRRATMGSTRRHPSAA